MKYVSKGLFVLALLIILAAPAQAESLNVDVDANTAVTIQATPAPKKRFLDRLPMLQKRAEDRQEKREENQEDRLEVRTEIKADLEAKRDDRQAETKERRENRWKEFAQRHYDRLKRRHAEYVNRFEDLIARLQENIDDKKADGKDVAATQAKLDLAKQQLVEAQTQSTTTLGALEKLSSTATIDAQLNVKALQDAQGSRSAFAKVHATLREVVKMLKELV